MKRLRVRAAQLGWRDARDFVTWAIGGCGFLYAITRPTPSEVAVFGSLALLGLPFVFRAEDRPKP